MTGRTVAHYRLFRQIGAGGMGDVYLAEDLILGRQVAVKLLPAPLNLVPDRMRRFIEEARAASALNHPNIATIHELREAAGTHFIVMEYVEGETLAAKLSRGPLSTGDIVRIAMQIADALDAAHTAGIIHRDIKSSNIMITPRGQTKVLDFGVAKRTTLAEPLARDSESNLTRTGVLVGTMPYMSPEQCLGDTVDARSDLFSLGVVLYEMATGRLPFAGSSSYETMRRILHFDPEPVRNLNPAISPGLERLVAQCLEKRPENRIQSAAELSRSLQVLQTGTAAQAFPRPDSAKHNLPHQLTRFVGRRREIGEIRRLLGNTRLITLTGPGGIGKTRLAVEIAAASQDAYPDGVRLVEFASILDSELVSQTVAFAFGMREERGCSITATLTDHLKEQRLLLVLDNCEHLVGACARLIDALLRSCPDLTILATSRESLAITGEAVFRVPSLRMPDPQRPPDVAELNEHEAVELFVDRARSVKSTFAVADSSAPAFAKLCARLEGIPLAIELAASWVKVLSIEQIAARLNDRLNLLVGGSRTALPRHQTLLAAIDWSYNLLSEAEKILFRRLSVFNGGWTLEAAEIVCAGRDLDRRNVLELLLGLVDKSLVLTDERHGQERYRFMVTLLDYAQRRLMETEETAAICRARAEFFVDLVSTGESKLLGAEQQHWLERLNTEYDNIRAVLDWTAKNHPAMALRLAGALGRFWFLQGYWDEGRRWLAEILALEGPLADPALRVKAMNAAARLILSQGELAAAHASAEEALRLSRRIGDARQTGEALNSIGILAGMQGEHAAARSVLEQSLTIRRELGEPVAVALTLNNIGVLASREAEFQTAIFAFEECLAIFRRVGDKHGIAMALMNRGDVAKRLGDLGEAHALNAEALALSRKMGDRTLLPIALNSLGQVLEKQGKDEAASALQMEALEASKQLGDRRMIASAFLSLGVLAERRGEYPKARSLFEETLAIRRALGDRFEIVVTLNALGRLATCEGQPDAAAALHQEALTISEQLPSKEGIADSLAGLADCARADGDDVTALSFYKQSLRILRNLGEKAECLRPLENAAAVIMSHGEHARSVRHWAAAQALRERMSLPRSSNETEEYNHRIADARIALGEERFAAAWTEGQAAGTEAAIDDALQESR